MQTIYYTDDDTDDLDIFSDAVEQVAGSHIALEVFQDGDSLLKTLRKGPKPGFAVLDINMPVKSGLDILKEIREDQDLQDFPVIIYSTSSEQSIIQRARDFGANFYAIKPSNFNALISLATKMISINWNIPVQEKSNFLLNAR